LRQKGPEHVDQVWFDQLLRQDAVDDLRNLSELRLVDLKMKASFIGQLRDANDSLFTAFNAAQEFSDAEVVEIVIRKRPRSKRRLAQGVKDALLRVVGHERYQQEVDRFIVKGVQEDGEAVETVDLLGDRLVLKKDIRATNARSRMLDSAAAFTAIREAYAELRLDLEAAPGVHRE
jgi:hypothetical protein